MERPGLEHAAFVAVPAIAAPTPLGGCSLPQSPSPNAGRRKRPVLRCRLLTQQPMGQSANLAVKTTVVLLTRAITSAYTTPAFRDSGGYRRCVKSPRWQAKVQRLCRTNTTAGKTEVPRWFLETKWARQTGQDEGCCSLTKRPVQQGQCGVMHRPAAFTSSVHSLQFLGFRVQS